MVMLMLCDFIVVVDLFIPTGEPQQGATRHIRGLVSDLEVEVALPKDEKVRLLRGLHVSPR